MRNDQRVFKDPDWVSRFAESLGIRSAVAREWRQRKVYIQSFYGACGRAGFVVTLEGMPPRFIATMLWGHLQTYATSIMLPTEGKQIYAGPHGEDQQGPRWKLLIELLTAQRFIKRSN